MAGSSARPSWREFWMGIAEATATRSTCDRAHVGCVLVRENRQLSMGYNGSIRKQPHCDDVGHLMVDGHCVRSVHSEINALVSAAAEGISVAKSTAFITHFPCWGCFKALLNAGTTGIVYKTAYLNGMNRAIYDAIVACRSQINITDMAGMGFFHYTPVFKDDQIIELKLGS